MEDLNDFYYFAAVVEGGGFAAAGRALGLPKSRLSRRVLRLESRLGVRLLNRSSRRFSVTDAGRVFNERCQVMLMEARAAEQAVAEIGLEPRGVVRVSCPTALLAYQFDDLLVRFMAAFPSVELHLAGMNRPVDVIAEGFDIAVRVRTPPLEPTDLVVRKLDESSQCVVASPDLVAAPLASPNELRASPSLDLGPVRREHAWSFAHADGRVAVVQHRPRLVTDDMGALRKAALAGIGVVQLPTVFIWEDVRAGRLVSVLPDWRPQAGIVHAVFPSRRDLRPSVRALLDFLARGCAEQRERADHYISPAAT